MKTTREMRKVKIISTYAYANAVPQEYLAFVPGRRPMHQKTRRRLLPGGVGRLEIGESIRPMPKSVYGFLLPGTRS
jgi:hypothetical protein